MYIAMGLCALMLAAGPGITKDQAQRTAIAAVRGGTVKSERQATEAGKPVYEFDINVANKGFVELVTVDENTGKVVGETYDGPQMRHG